MKVLPGLDVFLRSKGRPFRGARFGLIVHQASVTSALEPAPEAFRRAGLQLTALFAPEHGIAGALQDQVSVDAARDPRLNVPVHSLYGDPTRPAEFSRLSPSDEMLRDVDVLVFDLQDVGVRYYTFVWTMALAMKAAARAKKPFVVLDRPNPLGGEMAEGNRPDPAFASFVGLHPVPVRHGLTAGELARHVNAAHGLEADLHVVPMKGWRRKMFFDGTGLPWVMPSPNMPSLDTALVYAGGCLLEGTNLSEGRGTTRPFEITGAPYVDGPALAGALNAEKIPGARFRPAGFQPTFHKWAGRPCGGVQVHVTDRSKFRSFTAYLRLIRAARRLWPKDFAWKQPPYEYDDKHLPFDLLCGTDAVRRCLETDGSLEALEKTWRAECARFRSSSRSFLLYS
jgi:uncharacterized protein YbbC (DUF1343 family)